MQADFILFMRAELYSGHPFPSWWPETLVWLSPHQIVPFEVFARAKSSAYFDRAKVLLGVDSTRDLEQLVNEFAGGKRHVPQWQFIRVNPPGLLGFNELASKP
jgi:hypothetical protein